MVDFVLCNLFALIGIDRISVGTQDQKRRLFSKKIISRNLNYRFFRNIYGSFLPYVIYICSHMHRDEPIVLLTSLPRNYH